MAATREKQPKFYINQLVTPQVLAPLTNKKAEEIKVKDYTIVATFGEGANVHADKDGRIHTFWHKELVDGRKILIHHGGEEGFAGVIEAMAQHKRVILRKIGVAVDVTHSEEEDLTPSSNLSIQELGERVLTNLNHSNHQEVIPGEQAMLGYFIEEIIHNTSKIPSATTGELTRIKESLDNLLSGKIGRSTNKYLVQAANHIEKTKTLPKNQAALELMKSQLSLMQRMEQNTYIVVGTMHRYSDLERANLYWADTSARLPGRLLEVKKLANPEKEVALIVDRLRTVQGQPYLAKAQGFIEKLSQEGLFEVDPITRMSVLDQIIAEAQPWRDFIREHYVGKTFGEFDVKLSDLSPRS